MDDGPALGTRLGLSLGERVGAGVFVVRLGLTQGAIEPHGVSLWIDLAVLLGPELGTRLGVELGTELGSKVGSKLG